MGDPGQSIRLKLVLMVVGIVVLAFLSITSVLLVLPLPFLILRWRGPLYGLAALYALVGLLLILGTIDPFSTMHHRALMRMGLWSLGDAAFSLGAALWIARRREVS